MVDSTVSESGPIFLRPLTVRNFRLMWIGSALSMLGGQLTLIAFPWLVLRLTSDSFAMGAVLAASGVPRALLMIFGGAFTDRFSPLRVLIWMNWIRMALMLILASLVFTGSIEMWMVFLVAILFGAADAFTWPASSAILPRVLPPELFPPGNSLVQGMGQLSQMLGPVLDGLIIAHFSTGDGMAAEDLLGISVVFYLDAFGFVVALIALNMMRLSPEAAPTTAFNISTILQSSWEGVVATWNDFPVRMLACMFAVFAVFFRGPYLVGIPMLAHSRFEDGALSFGLISSAFGVGALIGLLLAGSLKRPANHHLGLLLLIDIIVLGIGFVAYAFTTHIEVAMLFSALSGVADGYVIVIIISFLQIRIPQEMLGRVMSVIMIFNMGLLPLSAAVSGALIRISLEAVLLGAGSILICLALISSMVRQIRTLGLSKEIDAEDALSETVDADADADAENKNKNILDE